MTFIGKALKVIGWFLIIGPLSLFVAASAYVIVANPADQAGWGAVVGAMMIVTMATLPTGLLVLLVGFVFLWLKTKDGSASPS